MRAPMRTLTLLVAALFAAKVQAQAPSCPFAAGALPAATLPAGPPHGAQLPLNTIVALMQETRSFDPYSGRPPAEGKPQSAGEPKSPSNPDPAGGAAIRAFHQKRYCEVADLDHSWNGTHREWNGGALDGLTPPKQEPAHPRPGPTNGANHQHRPSL